MADLIVRNGLFYDGLGGPGVAADVAITAGRVTEVGEVPDSPNATVLDATGKIVCPGFIDIHSHADFTLAVDGRAQSSVAQGITSIVTGNCGHGVAPVSERSRRLIPTNIPGWRSTWDSVATWRTFPDYLAALRAEGQGANVFPLVAHGALRLAVVGFEVRELTARELDRARGLAAEAMDAGAVGLSTGLEYAPGIAAGLSELVSLAEPVGQRGGFYATHPRNRTDHIVEAAVEAVTIAEQSGCRLQLSHFVRRPTNTSRDLMYRAVDAVRAARVPARLDVFPFDYGPTPLSAFLLPMSFRDGTREQVAERLGDPAQTRALLSQMDRRFLDALEAGIAETCYLASDGGDGEFVGRSLGQLARQWQMSVPEVGIELMRRAGLDFYDAMVVERWADWQDLRWALRQPDFLVMGDGLTGALDGPLAGHALSLADWGYAPQMLGRFVREEGLDSLAGAIARMTSQPARQIGLTDRGVLAAGYHADLVVFDAEAIGSPVTADNLIVMPTGVEHVLVNGEAVIHNGRFTGARPGIVGRPL